MPIAATDLSFVSCANIPTDDTSSSGGAIDATASTALTQFTAAATPAIVSDGADTRDVTIIGRLASGVVDTETQTLNGATEVVFAKTFASLQSITIAEADGARTVTVKQGSGGATVATIGPGAVKRHILFANSTSEAAATTRYEKQFAKNSHATLALLAAEVTLTADPAAKIKIGLGTVGGSTSVTNRKTAPGGVTFVDDGVAVAVPGTNLAAGAAVEVWVQQSLGANDAAQKSTFTLELSGSTVE